MKYLLTGLVNILIKQVCDDKEPIYQLSNCSAV